VIHAHGAEVSFNLKQALEFNKYTLGLAAAGFAYVGKIATDTSNCAIKVSAVIALISFATSTVFGILVMGRASKLDEGTRSDRIIERHGQLHAAMLLLGLGFAAIVVFISILGPKSP
jgi:hypothetical protein